jgi:predicted ATPase
MGRSIGWRNACTRSSASHYDRDVEGLLERDEELTMLADVVAAAYRGHGELVLLGGEAGIGKTSLLRALRTRLRGAMPFLIGGCEPLSVPIPLAPLRELAAAADGPGLGAR